MTRGRGRRRNHVDAVAQLLVGDRHRLPRHPPSAPAGASTPGASLRHVRIVGRAASRRPIAAIVRPEPAAAAAGEEVRDVEDRSVVAPDREVVGVAVGDRARARPPSSIGPRCRRCAAAGAAATERPGVKPVVMAKSAVSIDVRSTPPFSHEVLQVRRRPSSRGRGACRRFHLPIRGLASPASSSTAADCRTSACR